MESPTPPLLSTLLMHDTRFLCIYWLHPFASISFEYHIIFIKWHTHTQNVRNEWWREMNSKIFQILIQNEENVVDEGQKLRHERRVVNKTVDLIKFVEIDLSFIWCNSIYIGCYIPLHTHTHTYVPIILECSMASKRMVWDTSGKYPKKLALQLQIIHCTLHRYTTIQRIFFHFPQNV